MTRTASPRAPQRVGRRGPAAAVSVDAPWRRHRALDTVPANAGTAVHSGCGVSAATLGSIGPRIFLTIALSTNVHSIDVTMYTSSAAA